MPVAVATAVAKTANEWAVDVPRFSVVWHAGEPLTAGRAHLGALMDEFAGVEHHVQTNATLIDDAWCEFFAARDIRLRHLHRRRRHRDRRAGSTAAAGPGL